MSKQTTEQSPAAIRSTMTERQIAKHLYLALLAAIFLLGQSDFVARLQAVLFGSLSLLLTYKLGEMLWTRKEGLIGAFLLAINAYHIHYSQEARHYALMVFLALASLIFLLRALRSGQKRMWILFGLSAGLNIYTHYFAFLILASEVLFAAWVIFESWLSSRRARQQTNLPGSLPLASPSEPAVSVHPSMPARSAPPPLWALPSPLKQALSLVAVLAAP